MARHVVAISDLRSLTASPQAYRRFLRALVQAGRYAEPHDKVYCLLRTAIRITRADFFDCLAYADPPHVVVKTYAQKGSIGTERCEFRFLQNVLHEYHGECSLRLDIGCYVYSTPASGVTLCRARTPGPGIYTNPL